jgi:hypothetical protein
MKAKHRRGRGRALYASALLALALSLLTLLPATAGASVPNAALINGESVTTFDGIEKAGEPISLEQFAAEQAGYSVTVRSGAEWEAMSPAEFAQYQVLVVGDPNCSDTAQSAVNSAGVWTGVVMGSTGGGIGNRVVVGTDPEDHYHYGEGGAPPSNPADPTTAGAEHLIQRGIGFAGAVPGATGVYFDTSCDDGGGADVGVFNALKAPGAVGEWVEDPEGPECESPVVQIATNPAFHSGPNPLTNTDISGWECSSHVTFLSFPSDWTALAIATPLPEEIRPTPVCGNDIENPAIERCGSAYVLIAGQGIVAKAPNLSLEPETHSDTAGGQHTVIANAHKDGKPIVGLTVNFVVTETNGGVSGTCTTTGGAADPECKTDELGNVLFTYGDAHGVGRDTIVGSITLESTIEEQTIDAQPAATRTVTTNERATATEEWTPAPQPAPIAAVLPAKVAKAPGGKASVASVRGCVAQSSYKASVHGSSMQTVKFVLDGHTLKTVHVKSGATKASANIAVHAGAKHHLTIKVSFTSASGTKTKTFHRTLARCAARRVVEPRFTG